MSIADIASRIQKLPPQKQEEVSDFIDFLLDKNTSKNPPNSPIFGSGKGLVKFIADDFDAPLEDFKDYM